MKQIHSNTLLPQLKLLIWGFPALPACDFLPFKSTQAQATKTMQATHYDWANLTIGAITMVFLLWLFIRIALFVPSRLRWIDAQRQNLLLQRVRVCTSALIIIAALVPYLIMHAPGLALGTMALMAIVGCATWQERKEMHPPQEGWE